MGKRARDEVRDSLEHDAVADELGVAWEWLTANCKLLVGLLVLLVVVVAGLSIYNNAQQRAVRDSNQRLARALTAFSQVASAEDDEARRESASTVFENVKTLTEAYPDRPVALEALYLRGNTHYMLEEFPEAQAAYEQYIEEAPTDRLKARGQIALAYAYENESFLSTEQGSQQQIDKLDVAFSHYDLATQLSPAPSHTYYYALLGEARIHELKGENDEAIAIYERIIVERPALESDLGDPDRTESALLALVRSQLQEMESQLSFAAAARLRLERLGGAAPRQADAESETTDASAHDGEG